MSKGMVYFRLAVALLLICMLVALLGSYRKEELSRAEPAMAVGADVAAVAQASVELLRKQARLTVLTSTLRADATSKVERYGMSGEIMSLGRAEARLGVNLAGLRDDGLSFDGTTLTLTVPRSLLTVERGPLTGLRSVRVGGFLLASGSVVAELESSNQRQLELEMDRQAKVLRPLAETQVVSTLRAMLEMPLRAVGSKAVVVVRVG